MLHGAVTQPRVLLTFTLPQIWAATVCCSKSLCKHSVLHRLKDTHVNYLCTWTRAVPVAAHWGKGLRRRNASAIKCNIKIMERLSPVCFIKSCITVWDPGRMAWADTEVLIWKLPQWPENFSNLFRKSSLSCLIMKWILHFLLYFLITDFSFFIIICLWASHACLHLLSWELVLRKRRPDLSTRTALSELISANLIWLCLTAKGCGSSCET